MFVAVWPLATDIAGHEPQVDINTQATGRLGGDGVDIKSTRSTAKLLGQSSERRRPRDDSRERISKVRQLKRAY